MLLFEAAFRQVESCVRNRKGAFAACNADFKKGVSVGHAQKTIRAFIWIVFLLSGQLNIFLADLGMVISTLQINPTCVRLGGRKPCQALQLRRLKKLKLY